MKLRNKFWRAVIMLLGLLRLTADPTGAAGDGLPSEYEVKAAFLFNFGKFVNWPPGSFDGTNGPLVIGVWGMNPFHDDLRRMVAGKYIAGHPVVFRALTAPGEAANCHILFVSQSAQKDAPAILAALAGAKVLTVTESLPHFAASGFAINLVMARDNVRFEINNPAAARAGLTISSKLRSLALPPDP